MNALKAQVKGGRLVLDAPTSLPEGAEVDLAVVGGDDLDDAERAALHRALDESFEDEVRGSVMPLGQVIAELRAGR